MTDPFSYRFERLKLGHIARDMLFTKNDLGPGDIVEFDLPVAGGDQFRSADLSENRSALVIFGSYTCPVTASAIPGLNDLHALFGQVVRFVMVNVREAHPGSLVPVSGAPGERHQGNWTSARSRSCGTPDQTHQEPRNISTDVANDAVHSTGT
jgi:hypothetical protein